jgi:hypothetical protein
MVPDRKTRSFYSLWVSGVKPGLQILLKESDMSSFLSTSSYKKNGFVIIKNVIPKEDISALRNKLMGGVKTNFIGVKGLDYVTKVPELYQYQFNQKVVKRLKEIFGDNIYIMNDMNLHFNNADNRGKLKGWHIDANSEYSRYVDYLFHENYQFCKVGFYLQDNSVEFGGGIDVEIGGHRSFRNTNHRLLNLLLCKLDRLFLSKFRKRIRVPIEAGDCVIFDSRLPHSSSKPLVPRDEVLAEKSKITLYYDVAGNKKDAERFFQNSSIRVFTSDGSSSKFFTSYLRYYFPDSYPDSYVSSVNDVSGVSIYSLGQAKAEVFDRLYQQSGGGEFTEDASGVDLTS